MNKRVNKKSLTELNNYGSELFKVNVTPIQTNKLIGKLINFLNSF